MNWALTWVFKPTNDVEPGFYVTETNLGPGILPNDNSITWFAPKAAIAKIALKENKSPLALASNQLARYIMEFYQCPCPTRLDSIQIRSLVM